MKIFYFLILFCFIGINTGFAQDSLQIKSHQNEKTSFKSNKNTVREQSPLAPPKAAFYSAVLPGLGQAYNHSYWKIPIVYAGLGTSIYFYIDNNKKFHSYRDAYKRRLAGYQDDEYQGRLSDAGLIEAQRRFRKNKEISIFATIIIYALNIIDANVQAHLKQFNVNDNLSVKPDYKVDHITGNPNYGLSFNLKF